MKTAACVRCDKELSNVGFCGKGENQPDDGVEFITHGHYGTTVFDPMDGSGLAVNLCDDCLQTVAAKGNVLHFAPGSAKRAKWVKP